MNKYSCDNGRKLIVSAGVYKCCDNSYNYIYNCPANSNATSPNPYICTTTTLNNCGRANSINSTKSYNPTIVLKDEDYCPTGYILDSITSDYKCCPSDYPYLNDCMGEYKCSKMKYNCYAPTADIYNNPFDTIKPVPGSYSTPSAPVRIESCNEGYTLSTLNNVNQCCPVDYPNLVGCPRGNYKCVASVNNTCNDYGESPNIPKIFYSSVTSSSTSSSQSTTSSQSSSSSFTISPSTSSTTSSSQSSSSTSTSQSSPSSFTISPSTSSSQSSSSTSSSRTSSQSSSRTSSQSSPSSQSSSSRTSSQSSSRTSSQSSSSQSSSSRTSSQSSPSSQSSSSRTSSSQSSSSRTSSQSSSSQSSSSRTSSQSSSSRTSSQSSSSQSSSSRTSSQSSSSQSSSSRTSSISPPTSNISTYNNMVLELLNEYDNKVQRSVTTNEKNEQSKEQYISDVFYLILKIIIFVVLGFFYYLFIKTPQTAIEAVKSATEMVKTTATTIKDTVEDAIDKKPNPISTIETAAK